jgi:hypothetical protein
MVYNLQLPSEYKITPYSEFWLKQGNEYVKINNAKQLQKVFPEKEVLIKDYIKKNRPDFKKMKEVIDLINVVGV